MRKMGLADMSRFLAVALLLWPGITVAATYQLQVASVPERVFMYFAEGRTLPRVEAFLDDNPRSKFVLLRDRQPQLLLSMESDRPAPLPAIGKLSKPNDPWGPATWNGKPGQVAVFRVRGVRSDLQKLRRVAVQTDGVLVRFPVGGVQESHSRAIPVPATMASYLTHALESGTFADWAERRAVSYDGLSVIVGRHHNPQTSDTVYLVVRLPETGRAYKVILGWKTVKREGAYAIIPGSRH